MAERKRASWNNECVGGNTEHVDPHRRSVSGQEYSDDDAATVASDGKIGSKWLPATVCAKMAHWDVTERPG
jgi:hypothetical protein